VRGISFLIGVGHLQLLAMMHQVWWAAVICMGPVARHVAAASCECPIQSSAVSLISCFQLACTATNACFLTGVLQAYSYTRWQTF
jgi:hypothetical protein